MGKILVVDDETSIRDLIEMILIKENFSVVTASDGKSAVSLAQLNPPDLILLDIMLPDMSGHEVLKEIGKHQRVPVILLTARDDIVDKVLGLELGADDYITKPFDSRELVARIKAVLRRLGGSSHKESPRLFSMHDLVVNVDLKTATKAGRSIPLTPREFSLLEVLVNNSRKVFTREELLTKAWGYDYLGDSRAVDICITRLRKKIEDDPANPKFFITVYGFGYRFGGE